VQVRVRQKPEPAPESEDHSLQVFWQWFAIGVLVFCWIAEASMCADRGF
jgi:hypothetical protein